MRYRVGTEYDPNGYAPDQSIFMVLAVVGIIMGIGFVVAGWKGRQMWMLPWGAGLSIASVLYLGNTIIG